MSGDNKFDFLKAANPEIIARTRILYHGPEGLIVFPETEAAKDFWAEGTKWGQAAPEWQDFNEYWADDTFVIYISPHEDTTQKHFGRNQSRTIIDQNNEEHAPEDKGNKAFTTLIAAAFEKAPNEARCFLAANGTVPEQYVSAETWADEEALMMLFKDQSYAAHLQYIKELSGEFLFPPTVLTHPKTCRIAVEAHLENRIDLNDLEREKIEALTGGSEFWEDAIHPSLWEDRAFSQRLLLEAGPWNLKRISRDIVDAELCLSALREYAKNWSGMPESDFIYEDIAEDAPYMLRDREFFETVMSDEFSEDVHRAVHHVFEDNIQAFADEIHASDWTAFIPEKWWRKAPSIQQAFKEKGIPDTLVQDDEFLKSVDPDLLQASLWQDDNFCLRMLSLVPDTPFEYIPEEKWKNIEFCAQAVKICQDATCYVSDNIRQDPEAYTQRSWTSTVLKPAP